MCTHTRLPAWVPGTSWQLEPGSSSQETCSRGRTINQCSRPRGQEKAKPRFWGLQLMVAAGLLLWTLVGMPGWDLCLRL